MSSDLTPDLMAKTQPPEGSPEAVPSPSAPGPALPPAVPTATESDTCPEELHARSGLTKTQAEEFLDWLAANGFRDWRLSYQAGKGFTVQYR